MRALLRISSLSLVVVCFPGLLDAEPPLSVPLGLDASAAVIPADNPLTPEKIALGKQFFWDKRWSKTKTHACVTCHLPEHGWSDPDQFSLESSGKRGTRHSPTIINRVFSEAQQWPGTRASLEDQARNSRDRQPDAKWLAEVPYYREQFRKVFGRELDADGVALAISAYERTILSGNSPFDRFRAGDSAALTPAAQHGFVLFVGKARCVVCHSGFNFTDEAYHNIGVGMDQTRPDLGRHAVTKSERDRGAFKTPTLRDVAQRGPYMHDGSQRTLTEVVAFYDRGGHANPWLSPEMRPLGLTELEQANLVEFLVALTGEIAREVSTPPLLPE